MRDDVPPPIETVPAARRPWSRRLGRGLLLVLVTVYFLVDDVVLAAVRPLVARLAELRLFARLGAAIERLPPYPTLVLFLVPFAILEPVKIGALWVIATGHLAVGGSALAVAHLLSIVLVERLFHMSRAKLLTIPWFAAVYARVMVLYDWSVGRLRATATWARMTAALADLRARLRATRTALRLWRSQIFARGRLSEIALRFRRLRRR